MKLRNILKEIGDSVQIPPGATFDVGQHKGKVQFSFLNDDYTIEIRTLVADIPLEGNVVKIAIGVDFWTGEDNSKMTNKNQALKLMSMVVGSIEEYLIRLKKEEARGKSLQLLYIKFNPKSEHGEYQDPKQVDSGGTMNKRDRLYRIYIEKFAKKYNSDVTFSTTGGVIAKFHPPITFLKNS